MKAMLTRSSRLGLFVWAKYSGDVMLKPAMVSWVDVWEMLQAALRRTEVVPAGK